MRDGADVGNTNKADREETLHALKCAAFTTRADGDPRQDGGDSTQRADAVARRRIAVNAPVASRAKPRGPTLPRRHRCTRHQRQAG